MNEDKLMHLNEFAAIKSLRIELKQGIKATLKDKPFRTLEQWEEILKNYLNKTL